MKTKAQKALAGRAAPRMTPREALDALYIHPCAHPPRCMHTHYSQCREALVEAIVFAAENTQEPSVEAPQAPVSRPSRRGGTK